MRTLHEILTEQRELMDQDFDAVEYPLERICITNPQTLRDTNTIESWEF